jgi:hypothetical protein
MLLLADGQTAEASQALNQTNAHQEVGVQWIGMYFHLSAVKSIGFPL